MATSLAGYPTATPAPTKEAMNADGSFTGSGGSTYSPDQVAQIHNTSAGIVSIGSQYQQKYGMPMMASTSFGLPDEIARGTPEQQAAWVAANGPSAGDLADYQKYSVHSGTPAPAAGSAYNPYNPAINDTAAGQQANHILTAGGINTGIVAGAHGGKAVGGNHKGIVGGAAAGTPGYNAWNVTPEQTVEGRIQSINNPNNPIIAAARAGAVDQMNARGLSNSSLATSAADTAAYGAAIPIAQADAATAAKASGYNADIQNQMSLQGRQLASQQSIAQLQANTQRYSTDIGAATQTHATDVGAATQQSIANLNAETQKYTAGLDASTRTTLQGMQNQNSLVIQTNQQAATIFNQAAAAISTIQNNDKMDAGTKSQAISQVMVSTNNQLTAMSKSAGVSLSMANLPGFDAQGNYVGTPGADGAAAPGVGASDNPFANVMVNEGAKGP